MTTTWRRLAPPSWGHPALDRIEAEVARPDVARAIEEAAAREEYPREALAALRNVGLAELFDEEASTCQLTALNATLAARDGSLAITVGVNALALLPVWIAATEAQRRRVWARVREGAFASMLLTELEHGSDLLSNEARAVAVPRGGEAGRPGTIEEEAPGAAAARASGGGGPGGAAGAAEYLLYGDKQLINGGREHELLVALLRTRCRRPESGGGIDASGDFSLFLVDRREVAAGIEPLPRWRTLPGAAADISGVRFAGARVPADSRLGGEGEGFAIVQKTLTISRGGVSGLSSGAATAAWWRARAHARERVLYGAPIVRLGAIADHLARLAALDLACAALSVKQAAVVNARGLGAAHHTAVAKHACARLAEEAVDEGRRVLGARALVAGFGYDRLVRDVLLYGVFDGTSHVMLEQIQWRLAQLAARDRAGDDTVAASAELYGQPPRPLVETTRRASRPLLLPLAAHLRSLDAIPGGAPLLPLATAAEALLALVRELRAGGRWEADQGLRFGAAEALALLEAVVAVAELGDAPRRAALGLPPVAADVAATPDRPAAADVAATRDRPVAADVAATRDRPVAADVAATPDRPAAADVAASPDGPAAAPPAIAARFAIAWLGARACALIHELAARTGFAAAAPAGEALVALLRDHDAALTTLRESIRAAS